MRLDAEGLVAEQALAAALPAVPTATALAGGARPHGLLRLGAPQRMHL